MEFLHLNLLMWFLPLAAIPIVLHLFTLHRLRTVELSTYRFLFDSYVQQRRRMQFLDALLAFLRALFLLLLVLAISRPVVRHWENLFGSGAGREVVLLMDSSASMSAVEGGVSALDRAKAAANSVIERLDPNDRVTLIRVGARPEETATRFTSAGDALRERVAAIKASPSRANVFAALTHLYGPGKEAPPGAHLYFFTDGQAGGWSELRQQAGLEIVPKDTRLTVVNVGAGKEVANRAVIGDAPSQHRAIAGLPLKLRPRVANHSKSETQDVAVSVFIEDRELARKTLTLSPGETEAAEILFTPQEAGVLRGRYEISTDQFGADDSFYFTLTVEPQVRILLVNGNPASDPFENEGLYLRTALSSLAEESAEATASAATTASSGGTPESRASQAAFARSLDVQEIPESQLNQETLRDTSVVILANCGGLNAQHFTWLRDFVSSGGGLIVFPGDKVNHDTYSKQFFPIPNTPDESLISVAFKPAEGDPNGTVSERFGAIDFAHPVLSVFDNPDSRYFSQVTLQRRFPLEVLKDRGNAWPLIEFANGAPAMVESRYGEGRVLVSSFPATAKWSNLPLKPEFVPLVLRMISHVRRRPGVEGPSVTPADGTAEFSVASEWSPASGKVIDTAGRATPLNFEKTTSRLVSAFSDTGEKGYYTVEVNGGRSEVAQQGATAFAVNLAPEESNFAAISEPDLKKLLPGAEVSLIDASAQAQQLHGSIGQQREVWRPLILVLFVVIGIEFLLATLGGQKPDQGEPKTFVERIRDVTTGSWVGRMTGAGSQSS